MTFYRIGSKDCHVGISQKPVDSDGCLKKSSGWQGYFGKPWKCYHFTKSYKNGKFRDYCLSWRADLGRCCPNSCKDNDGGKSNGKKFGLALRYLQGRCYKDRAKSDGDCGEITHHITVTSAQCDKLGI